MLVNSVCIFSCSCSYQRTVHFDLFNWFATVRREDSKVSFWVHIVHSFIMFVFLSGSNIVMSSYTNIINGHNHSVMYICYICVVYFIDYFSFIAIFAIFITFWFLSCLCMAISHCLFISYLLLINFCIIFLSILILLLYG